MEIKSIAFDNNQMIPEKYTCDGEDISPPLEIKNIPEKTESLVLLVEDPDAPNGKFTHWIVFNISPESAGNILEGSTPGEEGLNDFGKNGYGGPCPPSGTHRYIFKIFALDKKLDLDTGATLEEVNLGMKNNILTQTELIGLYIRKQKTFA